jgi:hypothetical protein
MNSEQERMSKDIPVPYFYLEELRKTTNCNNCLSYLGLQLRFFCKYKLVTLILEPILPDRKVTEILLLWATNCEYIRTDFEIILVV